MPDIDKIYYEATSIDIHEQMDLWDERGKGYYGEYMLFSELYKHVPGQCKILMNLNIPASNGKTTELDCVLIHESGVYVFECKHYKGTIYGDYNGMEWTQYFRTSPNSHFPSPIKQNAYHIDMLRKLFPQTPIRSFVVFTNSDTLVKVTGWENTDTVVCRLNDIGVYLGRTLGYRVLSAEQIDEMFNKLYPYASPQKETVCPDKEPDPFVDYYNHLQKDFEAAKVSLRAEASAEEKAKYEKRVFRIKGLALALCLVFLILASAMIVYIRRDADAVIEEYKQAQNLAIHERDVANSAKKEAEIARDEAIKEKEEMAKKFRVAQPMNGGDIELADDFFEAYDVNLEMSKDLKDTVLFSGKIRVNAEQYGVGINSLTKIIVQMKDGSVVEYDKPLSSTFRTLSKPFDPTATLQTLQIYTSSVSDIAYIKLVNVSIEDRTTSKKVITDAEFELYSAKE